jgi:hypothetical protein
LSDDPTTCENSKDLFMDKETKSRVKEDLFGPESENSKEKNGKPYKLYYS